MSIERGPIDPPLTDPQYRFVMGRLSNYYDALKDSPDLPSVRAAAIRHLSMLDRDIRPKGSVGLISGLEQRLSS
jgi:hypothetical protein